MLPLDYLERTYAGVLGKLIGVYLGRPFEGWTYERIMAELGEITDYVDEKRGVPLIVTDDDISGTFTFLRALPDHGNQLSLTADQIGQSWLNYIIERRTILWWGGMGNSTEHTAFLRLKNGIPAPRSGSIGLNSKVVAEQIGAQIFIDGWAMVSPGDPERAAALAYKAASVSHDGEAIYGAQIIAAIEAQAYVERDINLLLDTALRLIPASSLIYRMIGDIREWHAEYRDWHQTREQIVANYGYDKYGGNCHMVPNHALIIMSLLHGEGDFGRSLLMVNTAGWDTDCNSGNVGCILGIRNGLAGLTSGLDWRKPLADRMYLPTADGGRAITDAVSETYHVVNIGRALNNLPALMPKNGARFHFELPDSVQGFQCETADQVKLENVPGHSAMGTRSLAVHYKALDNKAIQIGTPTFIPIDALKMPGYELIASPTLYPGQTVHCRLSTDSANSQAVSAALYLNYYGANDQLITVVSDHCRLPPGTDSELTWRVPDLNGSPIAEIGLSLTSDLPAECSVYLDYLTWEGPPDVILGRPADGGTIWRRAWVDSTDQAESRWPEAYRLVQNAGRGMLVQGTNDWVNYQVTATIVPHMAAAAGIGACVQGLRRYYALALCNDGIVELSKVYDQSQILGSAPMVWTLGHPYTLGLNVQDKRIQAFVDGKLMFDIVDTDHPLLSGGVALICEEGRVGCEAVEVRPA